MEKFDNIKITFFKIFVYYQEKPVTFVEKQGKW